MANQVEGIQGKLKAFISLQGLNVLLALIAPLLGIGLVFLFPPEARSWYER